MTKLDFASQSQEKEETCICGGRKHTSRFRDYKLQEYYLLRASVTKCSSRSVEITEIYFLVLWKQTFLLELPRPVLLMWPHVVFLLYTTVTVCLSSDKDVICIGLHSYSFGLILKCSSLWRLDHYFFFLKGDCYISHADLELLISSNLPASASPVGGAVTCYQAQYTGP